ncbi:four helix bundle protein [Prosthecobacter sp.]|uniref:four helix bundle protein n=1 Tax=Prosthecobacter sp. TaxID=1965333 RepID=UPI0037852CE8
MANIEQFEDILAWQKGRELTKLVYRASRKGEFAKDFALRDQIRSALISITSNIAEGFERGGTKEFIQFLGHSKGSCGEVRSQLYVALDESYLTQPEWQELHNRCLEVSRLLDGFIKYLRQTEIKGRKFQTASAGPKG